MRHSFFVEMRTDLAPMYFRGKIDIEYSIFHRDKEGRMSVSLLCISPFVMERLDCLIMAKINSLSAYIVMWCAFIIT